MKTKTFDAALRAAYDQGYADAAADNEPDFHFAMWRAKWGGRPKKLRDMMLTDQHTGMTEAEAERLLGPIVTPTWGDESSRTEDLGSKIDRLTLGNSRGRRRSW